MEDRPQNPSSRIDPAERRNIRATLRMMTTDELFEDIAKSQSMRRHPFATGADWDVFTFRIVTAKTILRQRFAKQLDTLPHIEE